MQAVERQPAPSLPSLADQPRPAQLLRKGWLTRASRLAAGVEGWPAKLARPARQPRKGKGETESAYLM